MFLSAERMVRIIFKEGVMHDRREGLGGPIFFISIPDLKRIARQKGRNSDELRWQ